MRRGRRASKIRHQTTEPRRSPVDRHRQLSVLRTSSRRSVSEAQRDAAAERPRIQPRFTHYLLTAEDPR